MSRPLSDDSWQYRGLNARTPGLRFLSNALIERAEAGEPVVAGSADLQRSNGLALFASRFPERYIQFGISEQSWASTAPRTMRPKTSRPCAPSPASPWCRRPRACSSRPPSRRRPTIPGRSTSASAAGAGVRLVRHGIRDEYTLIAPPPHLYAHYKLDAAGIGEVALAAMRHARVRVGERVGSPPVTSPAGSRCPSARCTPGRPESS